MPLLLSEELLLDPRPCLEDAGFFPCLEPPSLLKREARPISIGDDATASGDSRCYADVASGRRNGSTDGHTPKAVGTLRTRSQRWRAGPLALCGEFRRVTVINAVIISLDRRFLARV